MPSSHLNETFWQNWLPTKRLIDRLQFGLEQSGTLSTRDLSEQAVSLTVEAESNELGSRVYSPEQVYEAGEVVFFLTSEGHRFAQVLHIEQGRSAPVGANRVAYDAMLIRYAGEHNIREFVSNCPAFPLRFSGELATRPGEFTTPGTIVTKFYSVIVERLRAVLEEDGRFIEFADHWAVKTNLASLDSRQRQKALKLLRERGSLSCAELAKQLLHRPADKAEEKLMEFSVAVGLQQDELRRFAVWGTPLGIVAALDPPAKEVGITLTDNSLLTGSIPVGRELQKMLHFYQLDSPLTFTVYGDYEIRGAIDHEQDRIAGSEIRDWYHENRLEVGHQIHIKAPDSGCGHLRLYTQFEKPELIKPGPSGDPHRPPQFLRHRIYVILQESGQYLHYREITEKLGRSGGETRAASVEAILSANSHLFVKRGPATGLWGLLSWGSDSVDPSIAPTSLLLAIGEEKWVRQVLQLSGVPLSAKEMSTRLAELFQVRVGEIRGLSFIDVSDPELIQLADNRWALQEWIAQWKQRIEILRTTLQTIADTRGEISDVRLRIESIKQEADDIQATVDELDRRKNRAALRRAHLANELAESLGRIAELDVKITNLSRRVGMPNRQQSVVTIMVTTGVAISLASFVMWMRLKNVFALYAGSGAAIAVLCSIVARSRWSRTLQVAIQQHSVLLQDAEKELGRADDLRSEIQRCDDDIVATQGHLDGLHNRLEAMLTLAKELNQRLTTLQVYLDEHNEPALTQELEDLSAYLRLASRARGTYAI